MRDRSRDKGVKVCPAVEMGEIHFLEDVEEEKSSGEEGVLELNKGLSDGEGT